jgi:transcriptional regulator with XRE-family HTH domain
MKFKEKLKSLREKAGLSQSGLAEKAGLPIGNIKNYEQGIRMPLLPAVVRLVQALGTDCTAFADCEDVAGEEKPKPKPKGKGKK